MHRVELKVITAGGNTLAGMNVPNAPCGVERRLSSDSSIPTIPSVPNAPCGVESKSVISSITLSLSVPNAPCGVERAIYDFT